MSLLEMIKEKFGKAKEAASPEKLAELKDKATEAAADVKDKATEAVDAVKEKLPKKDAE